MKKGKKKENETYKFTSPLDQILMCLCFFVLLLTSAPNSKVCSDKNFFIHGHLATLPLFLKTRFQYFDHINIFHKRSNFTLRPTLYFGMI